MAFVLPMSTAGCLITNPPQFKAEKHTAPFLVAASAKPDPRTIVSIDGTNPGPVTFEADVVSQDDPASSMGAFRQVSARLYIDYGFPSAPGAPPFPFAFALPGKSIPAGTLDQTSGRRVSVTWYPTQYSVDPGCHTATLVVSHIFDELPGCPSCEDDFSTITWQVLRCNSSMSHDCGALPVAGSPGACPILTSSCETFRSASDAGSSCPETPDGGVP